MYTLYKIVEIDDVEYDVKVSFRVDGKYYPQTLIDPAEYPELEITRIDFEGEDLNDGLSKEFIDELEKDCWASLED